MMALDPKQKLNKKSDILTEQDLFTLKANRKKARDPRSNEFIAPFDLFGVSARFFVDGRTRTLTWIGCICSSILVGTILTLFVFQVRSHALKSESIITTFDTDIGSSSYFDLNA